MKLLFAFAFCLALPLAAQDQTVIVAGTFRPRRSPAALRAPSSPNAILTKDDAQLAITAVFGAIDDETYYIAHALKYLAGADFDRNLSFDVTVHSEPTLTR